MPPPVAGTCLFLAAQHDKKIVRLDPHDDDIRKKEKPRW